MKKNYSIGLDIGTSSVGWAVINNDNFKLIKKGNKRQSMWGVRLFEEANSAADRRAKRSTRRRYARRRERIKYLQEIFDKEIRKVDSNFYQKLNDSFYSPKDELNKKVELTEFDKLNIFNNYNHKLKKEKEYPTIYHIRNMIINSTEKVDIRLIYLAIHHIIKYRGNFLYDGDSFNVNNLNIKEKAKELFVEINNVCDELNFDIDSLDDSVYELLDDALQNKSINDRKIIIKEILKKYFNNKFPDEFIKMIVGNKFDIAKFFNIELDKKLELSFKGTDFDDKYDNYEKVLRDKISVLNICKELYDMLFLKGLFGNSKETNISSLMIERYNKHKYDLKLLKDIIRLDKDSYKTFFKDVNKGQSKEKLCIYSKYMSNDINKNKKPENRKSITYDEFINILNERIEKIFDNNIPLELKKEYNKAKNNIENGTFLPKITNIDNGKYPYQLNKDELIKIIESQGKYYNFLQEKVNVSGKEKYKLVQLLEFKIPYYVGPLNDRTKDKNVKNPNAWLVRKDSKKRINPFNFEEVIDKEKTAEKFITRMISNCTYLINEKAIPANSILYSEFKVLNELKQIKINDIPLTIDFQHKIYNELFLNTDKTVTEKRFIEYIRGTKEYSMYMGDLKIDGYSNDKKFANTMKSYYDFFGENGIFENTNYNVNDAEMIIKWITVFEDKNILLEKVKKAYPQINVNKIMNKNYKGWSNLSEKLLTGIVYNDKVDGTPKNIMDLMWKTEKNFMQIMFDKDYKFQEKINELNIVNNTEKINYSLVENLATSPATKRGIYQALKVVEELVNYMGYAPTNIMIEMARSEEEKKRKDNRKDYLKKIYLENKKDIDNYNRLYSELEKREKIDSEKLFLYFIQCGKSMYSDESLDIENLNLYEVDHIIPRTLIKDDSIDNKALVLESENKDKAADFVLPAKFRTSERIQWWSHLKDLKLISSKKFRNLCRDSYSEKDIEGFINRQLVETRQITKHVANILNTFYNDTNIVYLNANLSSNYRDKYELFKYRGLNDLHHAHDAYLAGVLGLYQKDWLKKSTNFESLKELNKKLYNDKRYKDLKYGYVINSIDNDISTFNNETGELIFDADYFNDTVKNTLYQNDVLISKKTEIKTGKFFEETIYKKDDVKSKFNIKNNLLPTIYGGYNKTQYSYMKLIKYQKKNKLVYALIGIPILYESSKDKKIVIDNYIKQSFDIDSYIIEKPKIPFNTLIEYKKQKFLITGCGIASAELINATEFILSKSVQDKYKYLLNYVFNKKYPNMENYLKNSNINIENYNEFKSYCKKIFNEQAIDLFKYIIEYISINCPLYDKIAKNLSLVQDSGEFYNLPFEVSIDEERKGLISKTIILNQLFVLLKCNSKNANLSKLSKTIKFSDRVGRLEKINVKTGTIITKSVTGLKVRRYEF